ncbi:MAG: hypothetical protein KKC11_05200 [Candidatus Omnitrophica bacterium]|nr:hypothetical protein [Candidatus Omnitrophota bacterium]MBU0878107.1 hypothetical protein [Candidatus Omnitrophota bacterium]MBU0897199.1 hypothetical protein [Candidatus Omnitrophota bacterium]MBU1133494.1 hypothetical protein [Candidatus Omnitrophota bacterium]MBU1523123.1 hypothetical protein [Candidatus Omnitrophota bacterium]
MMKKLIGKKKGIIMRAQSTLEYTLIILTVAAAFMTMNVYVRRAVLARLNEIEEEINPPMPVVR